MAGNPRPSNGFQKGQPRPENAGRRKGTPNKTTAEIKEAIQKVLSNKVDELAADLEGMSSFKQWQILNAVARYVLPTYNKNEDSVEHSGEIKINVSYEDTEKPSTGNSDKNDDDFDF